MTPYGCLSRLVCVDVGPLTLARTGCQWYGAKGEALSLWLVLQRCPDPPPDELRPLYHCGFRCTRDDQVFRLVAISEAVRVWTISPPSSQELYITLWHTTREAVEWSPVPLALEHERIPTPFRLNKRALAMIFWHWKLGSVPRVRFDWDGTEPIAFSFSRSDRPGGELLLWFVLGVCRLEGRREHYARLYSHPARESHSPAQYLAHSCERDHISTWLKGRDDDGISDGMSPLLLCSPKACV